jgi:hypothetical protein
MTLLIARGASTRWHSISRHALRARKPMTISLESANLHQHQIHTTPVRYAEKEKDMKGADPRVSDIGRAIEDDFATVKDCYGMRRLFSSRFTSPHACMLNPTSSHSQTPNRPRTWSFWIR